VQSILKWAGENATLLGVAIAALGVAVTAFYTYLTARLLHENVELRKVETDPHVVAYLEPSIEDRAFIGIAVGNVGNGPAYDVTFKVESTYIVKYGFPADADTPLDRFLFFRNGVKFIAPQQMFRFSLERGADLLENRDKSGPIYIHATYYNKQQVRKKRSRWRLRQVKPHMETFTLDFYQFKNLEFGPTIHESLKDIERAIASTPAALDAVLNRPHKTQQEAQEQQRKLRHKAGTLAWLTDKLRSI